MVIVKLTNGFGNNLFQYIAGRLLAEFHGKELGLILPFEDYYGLKEFDSLKLKFDYIVDNNIKDDYIRITEKNYLKSFDKKYTNYILLLDGYFEDYNFYLPHLQKIKEWFPKINKRKKNDLVFHLRTGDRLFYKAHYDSNGVPLVSVKSIDKAIKNIEYERIYIVSDLPKLELIKLNELKQYNFHLKVAEENSVDDKIALNYHNSIIEMFIKYKPIFQNAEISMDFNLIRTFKNIIFQHSTLAWWAAALSDADSVGVYGPWRPYKGKNNKNLSDVPILGWYQWF